MAAQVRRQLSVRQALQQVADYPRQLDDDLLERPAHELIARALFEISNSPSTAERGAMTRANKARKMIMDRLVGKRRPGSNPATRTTTSIEFKDLTGGEIEGGTDDAGTEA